MAKDFSYLKSWLEPCGPFGCHDVDTYQHPELPGYIVKIGSHS